MHLEQWFLKYISNIVWWGNNKLQDFFAISFSCVLVFIILYSMEIALLCASLESGSLFYALIFYIWFQMSHKDTTEPMLVGIHWRTVLVEHRFKKSYILHQCHISIIWGLFEKFTVLTPASCKTVLMGTWSSLFLSRCKKWTSLPGMRITCKLLNNIFIYSKM